MSRSKRGFTLVEILLTILIIAILAGNLLLTSGISRDRSAAARIVSDLMTLKRAAMLFFSDNGRWPGESDYDGLNAYMTGHIQLQARDEDSWVYAIKRHEALGTVYAAARVADEFGGSPRIRKFLERDSSEYDLLNGDLEPYRADPVVAVKVKDVAPGSSEGEEDNPSVPEDPGGGP